MVTTLNGHVMYIPERDSVISPAILSGGYETRTLGLMVDRLHPGDLVVDIGSHVGLYTLSAARAVGPTGRVVALEPNPENYRLLQANIRENQYTNITPVCGAASNQMGQAPLFCDPENTGAHSLARTDLADHCDVDLFTVDDLLDAPPDFIKMDCEGWELKALEGSQNSISQADDLVILLEFSPSLLKRAGDSAIQLLGFLRDFSLTVYYTHTPDLCQVNELEILAMFPEFSTRHTNLWAMKNA